jgi:UDP-N-acetylmuramoyl-L-alanyl-D-glutamate--2,6-diaminopimelate ligase
LRIIDAWNGDVGQVINSDEIDNKEFAGVTSDSRQVRPGFLFVALPGSQVDGRTFINDAMTRGAIAVLAPKGTNPDLTNNKIPLITDINPRRRYSMVAAQFYKTQPHFVVAITGTNGKTSVAGFVRQILAKLGHKSASAGTLGLEVCGLDGNSGSEFNAKFNLTTPDAVDLHQCLSELESYGVNHLALEASSHGLDQCRLDGVKISAAAFTNLSRDHLDYHLNVEDYLKAKLRLFSELVVDGGSAVINADDSYSNAFFSAARARGFKFLSYGKKGHDIHLINLLPEHDGQQIKIEVLGIEYNLKLPLIGDFQAFNAMCALGLVVQLGENVHSAVSQLSSLKSISGRMEYVGSHPNGAAVFVDYAHTPDALENILKAFRSHTKTHLHVVFGCGGDRDSVKRSEMGEIASRLADRVIVTDDNPRSEDPALIRKAVLSACPSALEIGNRRLAILRAIENLEVGDILVLAGKGHESGQIIGNEIIPFDDRETVREILKGLSE